MILKNILNMIFWNYKKFTSVIGVAVEQRKLYPYIVLRLSRFIALQFIYHQVWYSTILGDR